MSLPPPSPPPPPPSTRLGRARPRLVSGPVSGPVSDPVSDPVSGLVSGLVGAPISVRVSVLFGSCSGSIRVLFVAWCRWSPLVSVGLRWFTFEWEYLDHMYRSEFHACLNCSMHVLLIPCIS